MKTNNIVEFKLSKDLVEYDSAIEYMNTHINKMKKNNAKELIWFLEHPSIYTSGRKWEQNNFLIQSFKNWKLRKRWLRGDPMDLIYKDYYNSKN